MEKELSADDKAAMKEIQAELKRESEKKSESEKETEADRKFDPEEADISVKGIDPYELDLFQRFGLDNSFPRPDESHKQIWKYSTTGYSEDSQTGETKDGVYEYELNLNLEPQFYGDYIDEIKNYMEERYEYKSNSVHNNFTLLDNGNVMSYIFLNDGGEFTRYAFRVYTTDKGSLEGEITEVSYKELENGDKYPEVLTLKTADGEVVIDQKLWGQVGYDGKMNREYAVWEHLPQVGENLKIDYISGDIVESLVTKYKPDDERLQLK